MADRSAWTSRFLGTAVGVMALVLSGQAVLDALPREEGRTECQGGACSPLAPLESEAPEESLSRAEACGGSGLSLPRPE